jgi:sigma-E factor negative regulatory protein RseC
MKDEILVEEGIVLSASDGIVEVSLSKSDNCDTCSAKIICKPGDSEKKVLKVLDPFGVLPGDIVKISIQGADVLKASFILYGLPLVILIAGIFSGLSLFSGNEQQELFSFLFSLGLVAVYYLFVKSLQNKRGKENLPKIVFVKRNK